ncbi:BREX system ATP-binding domain-containing protein [Paraflavitalea soli]|nr:BREX system ATP-binding domain-containing protein [Paraflavitalea soli]
MLNLILQAPDYAVGIDDFRTRVLDYIKELSTRAGQSKVTAEKNPILYTKILKKAWENDGLIDKNESQILELLKFELGIWDREHFTLMHDESIIGLWDLEQEYYLARNTLLATGIVLTSGNRYVMADEVAEQIKKVFGIEIMDSSYKRLLAGLSREDLALILNYYALNVSGTKDAMIDRILNSLIPPSEVLNQLHLDSLRELCRRSAIQISGIKSTVIANILQFFDQNLDLVMAPAVQQAPVLPPAPELREMDAEIYSKILLSLTGQQLYDILAQSNLMTSGSKEEKVKRIVDSYLSERSALNHLRKDDIAQLCRKFTLQSSGSKQELIDRLLDYIPPVLPIPREIVDYQPLQPATSASIDPKESASLPISQESVPVPSGFDDVNAKFPGLNQEEKIILAILKEAKSITEQDLERIVAKHKLSWFLHKAHMAELMAKLKREGKSLIQIKSVQNTNIYQWIGGENADDQVVGKKSARDIIDALRHGVVPKNNLNLLMVGQQTAKTHLSEILLEVNSAKSHFKFIRGQYGSGKTFLCSWLKEFAIDNEFAVSFMNISHDQPLSDLPVFFSGMIAGLRTPEKLDSSALVDILESWLLNIHNKTAKIEGIVPAGPDSIKALTRAVEKTIEVELANLSGIEPGFSQALRAFYEGKVSGDLELTANAVAWITGSRSLSAQALRDIGVKGYLEPSNVFARMRAILEIISGARYKGLLLLVDELELVRKFPHARQREQALETLRLLIDEAGKNALPGCLLIFTGTDEFFEDERYGLRSYEALAERVMTPFTHQSFVSMRQPIISLESLDSERLNSVVLKIRDLYGIAYSWDAQQFADDASISQLIQEWTLFGEESVDRKPRPILREFIQMLDLCEENKGVSLSQFLKKPNLDIASPTTFHAN